jgi:hypothetical protein
MAAFYHLGYFPFCIEAPLQPLDRSVEMPLEDAMKLFWLVKQARFVLKFSYNAHLSDGGGTRPDLFVRALVNIDQTQSVYDAKSLEERVCLNEAITVSGSSQNEEESGGGTEYVLRFFANAGFTGSLNFARASVADLSNILPTATVRVSAILSITNSGYYSRMAWSNRLVAFDPLITEESILLPLNVKIDGNSYALSTAVGYQFYPFTDSVLPNATYEDFRLEFTT